MRNVNDTTGQSGRNPAADALASIPAEVVNLIADARVTSVAIGKGGAWIGSSVRSFDPPLRVEEAVELVAANLGGLRNLCMDLTNGSCLWLDASFRFSSFDEAIYFATRRARLRAEHEKERKPHGRPKKK